tara:strand:- start:244 stop:387 length:144 start_codon:yes stop_codon:yes gene_type:complete
MKLTIDQLRNFIHQVIEDLVDLNPASDLALLNKGLDSIEKDKEKKKK